MPPIHQSTEIRLRQGVRMALLGRVRMARWIQMPEREFAGLVETVEQDPLFQKMFFGDEKNGRVIRRRKWPAARMFEGFYAINESVLSGGERVHVEEALKERASLISRIRAMGRQAFERYFLMGEDGLSLDEIASRTGISVEDARGVHDLLLHLGAQEEFFLPPRPALMRRSYSCLAAVFCRQGDISFEFLSPYWVRGLYHIKYEALERWKRAGIFSGPERRRLRGFLGRLEMMNIRQNTIFRILETVTKNNKDYLSTRAPEKMRPIGLRDLARRLDLSPSTVSRALSGRSVRLPWGEEIPISALLPGRRRVTQAAISAWLRNPKFRATDAELAQKLKLELGIRLSRRAVNAARNQMKMDPRRAGPKALG
ncbi:MAG: RNA polymerase factor sigma-54 [Elusimicrobiota bacterium]